MKSFEEVYEVVKNTLSEKRFRHSEKVMERCVEFAKLYDEDVEKARLVGIAHDIAKEIPKAKRVEEAEKDGVILNEFEKQHTSLIHAKHGAVICEKRFGFSEDMCDAISFHSTAKAGMSKLDKILYLADFCEEDRTFVESKKAYEIGKENLDEAYLCALSENIKFMLEERRQLDIASIDAYNDMLK